MRWRWSAALFVLLAAACDQERPPGLDPNYCEPMVNGFLYRIEYYDGSVEYLRDFGIFDNDGLRMVPLVELNGQQVPCYHYSWTNYRYGDERYFPVHERYDLKVTHYWGTAFSRIVMPGNFGLTYPPNDSYILDLESTLVVTWTPSPGAQWYWLDLYCDYDFLDSLARWDDYEFEFDTVVGDTFLALPPGRVFPSHVMDVLEGDGSAMVWAGYGPPVEPGDYGNVRGSGYGFFNGLNEPRERYFWVGAPIGDRRSPGAAASRDKLRGRLQRRGHTTAPALRQQDPRQRRHPGAPALRLPD